MNRLNTILIIATVLLFAGCSNMALTEDAGLLRVDAGGDKTVLTGTPVEFEGDCIVKTSFYEPIAEWDFGDGGSEDGFTPTHTFSQPGVYTVELKVSLRFYRVSVTDEITVTVVDVLPQAMHVSALDQDSPNRTTHPVMNPCVTFLSDGRMVIAGTADASSPSEIVVAVETGRDSDSFNYAGSIMQTRDGNFPAYIKAEDESSIIIGTGSVVYCVPIDNVESATAIAQADNF
jgi:PKD repeat protein